VLEGVVDHLDSVCFNVLDLGIKGRVTRFPLGLVVDAEHVRLDRLQLVNLLVHTLKLFIDILSFARDFLQVLVQDGLEVFDSHAHFTDVLADQDDVLWLGKNLLGLWELPPGDGAFIFDVHPGLVELVVPLLEHSNRLINVFDRLGRKLLEDALNADLVSDLLADLVGDGLNDVLELVSLVVDVSGDGPDELESVQQGWQSVFDGLEVALVDVLELALKCQQELDEILGYSMLLFEVLLLLPKSLNVDEVKVLGTLVQVGNNGFDVLQAQLLVQGIVGSGPLRPKLGLSGGGLVLAVLGLPVLFLHSLSDHFGPFVLKYGLA
jgi:hypothetical protein